MDVGSAGSSCQNKRLLNLKQGVTVAPPTLWGRNGAESLTDFFFLLFFFFLSWSLRESGTWPSYQHTYTHIQKTCWSSARKFSPGEESGDGWGEGSRGSTGLPDNHTPRQLLIRSEELLSFQYGCTNDVPPWTSQTWGRKKSRSLIIHR